MGILEKAYAKLCPLCKKDSGGNCGCSYAVFRILIGLMFVQHGAQKLFGAFGGVDGSGATVEVMTLMGLAGIIELAGGILITLGLWTRLVATIAAIEMVFAFFMVHAQMGLMPIVNKGELAVVFFAAFVLMSKMGNGKWSLEKALFKKEVF